MGYCEKSDKRLWRERQEEWIKDLKKKGFSWGKLLDYDFSNEWALGDHKERSVRHTWCDHLLAVLHKKENG